MRTCNEDKNGEISDSSWIDAIQVLLGCVVHAMNTPGYYGVSVEYVFEAKLSIFDTLFCVDRGQTREICEKQENYFK